MGVGPLHAKCHNVDYRGFLNSQIICATVRIVRITPTPNGIHNFMTPQAMENTTSTDNRRTRVHRITLSFTGESLPHAVIA